MWVGFSEVRFEVGIGRGGGGKGGGIKLPPV